MCMNISKDSEIRQAKIAKLQDMQYNLQRSMDHCDKESQEYNSYRNMIQKISKKVRDLQIEEAEEALAMPECEIGEEIELEGKKFIREDVASKQADQKVEQESADLSHGALWCMAIAGIVGYALGKKKGQNQMIRQFVPAKIDE